MAPRDAFFQPEAYIDIPDTDLLSWTFDAPKYPCDKKVFIDATDDSRFFTHNTARTTIQQIAAGLRAAGLKKGDCVLIHAFNDICYPILVNGIIAAGGIFTGTNPAYTPTELLHHFATAKVGFIVSEPDLLPNILKAASTANIPHSRIFSFDLPSNASSAAPPPTVRSWRTLLTHGLADWPRFTSPTESAETTAMRLFSSGTTGLPKAVDLSHKNFIAEHAVNHEWRPRLYESTYCLPLPFFHAAAVPLVHTTLLKVGSTAYVLRRFDLDLFLSTIEKRKVTELGLVPPLVVAIVNAPQTKKYSLKSVRQAAVGAAPTSKEMQARLLEILGGREGRTMTQVWGMTETSCVATRFYYPEADYTGSVGRLTPNCEVKLVDEEGKDISGWGVRGEICIRGPIVMKGYVHLDNSLDEDGFFHTGDIGYCDEATRKWYIVDRKKELIKVRGFQVAPAELEGILLDHPEIIDAAVLGIPDRVGNSGELPRAYIVRRPGSSISEEEVKNSVKEKAAKYKWLEGGVRIIQAIPKTASGKILKRELREMAEKEEKETSAKASEKARL